MRRSPPAAAVVLSLAVALAGCPDSHGSAGDAGGALDAPVAPEDAPSATFDAGPTDGGAPSGDASSPCAYVDTIDRSCTTDADCLVRLHQTDCCGNAVMLGIRTSAESAYLGSEPACMASYPACGCPASLPTTDSGETVTDTSAVLAACTSRGPRNVCLTYVTMRPAPGR